MNQVEYLQSITYARELERGGIPMDLDLLPESGLSGPPPGLLITQVGDLRSTRAFTLETGMTGFMLDLEIVNNLPGQLYICWFELELPWQDKNFEWLPDPADQVPEGSVYRFPEHPSLEFPREQVVNHRTYKKGRLRRGDFLNGLLLGLGWEPIPERFPHFHQFRTTLTVVDSSERRFPTEVQLTVDRSAEGLMRKRREEFVWRTIRRPSILAELDPRDQRHQYRGWMPRPAPVKPHERENRDTDSARVFRARPERGTGVSRPAGRTIPRRRIAGGAL
jgi:hypothetical protein